MMFAPDLVTDILQKDIVYALATADRALYAARQSGLYRSHDAGITWVDALNALPASSSLTATAIAAQGKTVFVGVKGAVICSHDAGETWKIVGLASPPPNVVALALSPNYVEDGVVVAGTSDDGVFVSTDRGASWVAWNFGLIDAHVFTLAFSPAYRTDRTLFAGTESGLFVSKNGGRGWSEIDFPVDAAPVLSLAFSPTFAADGLIYAGTEANGLFMSDDSGKTWRPTENALISGGVNAILVREQPAQEIWLLLEDNVVFSADKGRSWQSSSIRILPNKMPMTISLHPTVSAMLMLGFADGEIIPVY